MSTQAPRAFKVAAGTGVFDVWWKTGRLSVKVSGHQTGGSFAQLETLDPHGAATPLHLHRNEDETFYVVEGHVGLIVDGERIDLGAGDFAFAPRGMAHAYIVVSDQARILTTLSPAGLEDLFVSLGVPVTGGAPPAETASADNAELVRRFGAYGCAVVGPPPTLADLERAPLAAAHRDT